MTSPAAAPAFRSPDSVVLGLAPVSREAVLFVDGSAVLRHLVGLTLESRGYLVTCRGSGRAALLAIAGVTPATVVVNDPLPDMTGAELVRLLRVEHGYAGGIVLTVGADGLTPRAVEGADVVLARPFTSLTLFAALMDCRSARRR